MPNQPTTPFLEPSNQRGMWAIPCAKIPAYLHDGGFYQSLDKDDDSLVHVPFDCIRLKDSATNLCEFSILLRTMQFWILDRIPDGVIEYCLYHDYKEWCKVALSVLGAESFVYRDLCAVFCGAAKNAIFRAIRVNRVEIVKYLACVSVCASQYRSITAYAARRGKVESLQALHACGIAWDKKTCAAAAAGGHLECLMYAHEHGCEWDEGTLIIAALHGHLECVKYAFARGCPCHVSLCLRTAQGGNLPCMLYLRENGLNTVDGRACSFAAQGGHIEVLKFLHKVGCPWDARTTDYAACAGKIETLRYAIENGCPHSRYTVSLAAGAGSLPCLRYLVHTLGIYESELENVFASAMLTGSHKCFAYLLRAGYRIGNFSFLSKPTTDLEKRCIAKPQFDSNFCSCLSYANKYGVKCDHFVSTFVQLYTFNTCKEFLREVSEQLRP